MDTPYQTHPISDMLMSDLCAAACSGWNLLFFSYIQHNMTLTHSNGQYSPLTGLTCFAVLAGIITRVVLLIHLQGVGSPFVYMRDYVSLVAN